MPATAFRRRFQNSLDMVAARPTVFVGLVSSSPAKTDSAWGMLDSPVLGRSNGFQLSDITNKQVEPLRLTRKLAPAAPVAPLNIKKNRRKGLVSGIHLVLPATPGPLATPGLTPQTSFTFTAEWDSTQRGFLFTPLSDAPSSAFNPRTPAGPVPDDIEEENNDVEPEPRPVDPCPDSASSFSSTSSVSSHSDSLFIHERKASTTSTAPSSIFSYAKPMPPSDEELLSLSEAETDQIAPIPESEVFDKSCLEGVDEDLLLHPWQAFDSLCWESFDTMAASRDAQALSSRRRIGKQLPDVPIDAPRGSMFSCAETVGSRFSSDGNTLAGQVPHRCTPLRFHIIKAFKFHRRAT